MLVVFLLDPTQQPLSESFCPAYHVIDVEKRRRSDEKIDEMNPMFRYYINPKNKRPVFLSTIHPFSIVWIIIESSTFHFHPTW